MNILNYLCFAFCLTVFFVASIQSNIHAEQQKSEKQPVCLLTGFGPFGNFKTNPSWEAVKTFEGKSIGKYKIRTTQLPVVYDEVNTVLKDAIEKHKPAIVISFGVGKNNVTIEKLAINGYHPLRPKDNKGNGPPRNKIIVDGPNFFPTALPVKNITDKLEKAGIANAAEINAGGYLCNECFYRLMFLKHNSSLKPAIKQSGFVHLPALGTPNGNEKTFDLPTLIKAVDIVTKTTIAQN